MNVRSIRPGRLQVAAALALFALTSAPTLLAQTETGQITGTVYDQSGGVVATATVTDVDLSTRATRTIMTTNGIFAFPNLLPGRHEVSATASGFQTVKQIVNVTVGSKLGQDFRLPVGTQTQVVEVQERATQVNTESQSVGANISGNEILNLPTITRNPYDLVKTVGNTTDSDPSGEGRGVGVSINGLRSADVNILLDGVPNKNNFDTLVAVQTPLDSVGEITVITNTFTAEYGKALAGIVNVDTKRGSNAWHGTAYEFNRVAALTSNTFDNNANGIPVSPFTRNQFGFSVGGPIKKDKLFVFGNQEWIRVRSVATVTAAVATPQLLTLSNAATQNFFSTYGKLKSSVFPLQTFTYGQACTVTAICTLLPASTPVYQKVAYNVPSDSGGGDPQDTQLFAGRVDYNYTDNTQFYFRYARFVSDLFPGTVTDSPYSGYDSGEADLKTSYALSGTHVFSPTFVGQTKLSYNRVSGIQGLSTQPIGPTLYTTLTVTNSLGGAKILYPGYSPRTPGNAIPFGGPQNYIQINQDFTKVMGSHNFRFGGLFTRLEDDRSFGAYEEAVEALGTNNSTALNGLVNGLAHDFQAAIYPQGKFPCQNAIVNGVSTTLVTPACTLTLPVGPPSFARSNLYHEAGLYVQDSWKVRPRLTLNLGLRWEYFGPQANKNANLDSNFFLGPGSNIDQQVGSGQVLVSTDPKNPVGGLWKKDWHDFSPRVGFAWDVFGDGKTSLRGGYGFGWLPNFGNVTFNVIQNPPNYGVVALTAGPNADVPTIPITTNNAGPLAGSSGTKPLGRVTLRAVDPDIKTAYAQLWSAVVERQFGSDLLAAVEYSGSKGSDLQIINGLNHVGSDVVHAGQTLANSRINGQYGNVNFRTNGGISNYNALNLRLEARNYRRHGLTMRFNYTWSHANDILSNTFSETSNQFNLGVLDPLNPRLDKGNADFDIRHRVLIAAVYEETFKSKNKIIDAALGGWSIVPNFTARTGTPFTLWDCTNAAVSCPRAMYNSAFHATYTDTSTGNPNEFNYMGIGTPNTSYANPLSGTSDYGPFPAGMVGRNTFRTPGVWNLDFAMYKTFSITERFKLQLRAETYNLFNHSNLYVEYGNTDVSGLATSVFAQRGIRADNLTTTENRNLQLALKLIF